MGRWGLLLALLSGISFTGAAQTIVPPAQQDVLSKGHIVVGLNAGQGYRSHSPTTSQLTPRIQYFITNNWAVAAEGHYLKSRSTYDLTYAGAGLSTRYYVIKTKRFALFGHVSAAYGQSKYSKVPPAEATNVPKSTANTNWQTSAGVGANYRLSNRLFAEVLTEQSLLPATYLTPDYNRWQTSVGIHYRIR